jgi:hypothetical protein
MQVIVIMAVLSCLWLMYVVTSDGSSDKSCCSLSSIAHNRMCCIRCMNPTVVLFCLMHALSVVTFHTGQNKLQHTTRHAQHREPLRIMADHLITYLA